jgi:hypothetical protein
MRKTIAMHQQVPIAFTPGSSHLAYSVTAPMGLHCAWSASNLITYCTHCPPRVRSGSCCVSGLTRLQQCPVLVVLASRECPLTT